MTPEFWETIDRARHEGGDPGAHAAAITSTLVESGAEDTLRFAAVFDQAIDTLYTWNLWGAAYLSFGGCSDDAFEYLRAWLIGAGERAWALARDDPEQLFIELLDGASDPDERWEELRIHEGESFLYAAGTAHERLTGEWVPARAFPRPDEPTGEEWAEDELPELYSGLFAVLPEDWWGEPSSEDPAGLRIMVEVERGVGAFSEGDHAVASELLDSTVEDSAEWELVAPDRRVDVAYIVGMGRLLTGDVEGASTAFRLVESEIDEADHVRRALAQVELARGDFDRAARFIDDRAEANRSDRVLAAKLAWRRGDRERAIQLAEDEIMAPLDPEEHVWDVAGSVLQLGQLFIEAGNAHGAEVAVDAMTRLLADAPEDLPLVTHHRLLMAGVLRLQGRPDEALTRLELLQEGLGGTDLAECLREEARASRALGDSERATALYLASVEAFDTAGERWEAGATGAEGARPE